jgi:hypothetical protein
MSEPEARTSWPAALLLRVERVEAALALAKAEAASTTEVHVRDFGGPSARATLDRPNTLFNRAIGLAGEDADKVPAIIEFFRALDIPPRIDVCPAQRSDALVSALRAAGLAPGGFPFFSRRVLFGKPALAGTAAPATNTVIERVAPADVEAFVAIEVATWPVSEAGVRRAIVQAHALSGPGHYRYLATIGGQRAAMAAMEVHDNIAYLSGAATLEAYRGRGCQTALIRQRLADAIAADAELAFSVVAPGTQSERNLRRAGLDSAYDREIWLPPDWTEHPFYRSAG